MNNGILIHDNADKVPPTLTGQHPLTPISGADFERPQRRLPPQVWIILTVACLAPVVLLLYAAYKSVAELLLLYPWLSPLIGAVLIGLLLLSLMLGLWSLGMRSYIAMQQARVVRTRLGVPVDIGQQLQLSPAALEQQAIVLELAKAPYLQYPNLSTLSNPGTSAKSEALQLPAPALNLIPDNEWLPWLNDAPHGLIAGSTNSGKTTLARIALRTALDAGAAGLVVDPKGKEWFGLPVVGGGWQMETIVQALDGIRHELELRYQAYGAGERSFQPLVIIVDEVPAIMQHCKQIGKRGSDPRWELFARSLGSLAREVSIRVWLLTQSPNVEDIGINGGMRSNYSRFALREKIPHLLNEDVDTARREQLRKLYSGQDHPCATIRRGQVHLLDTQRVPTLSQQAPRQVIGWHPPTITLVSQEAMLRSKVRDAIQQGRTRRQARQEGLSFDNGLWSELNGKEAAG